MNKPDPKDYEGRIDEYRRDIRLWQWYNPSVKPDPSDYPDMINEYCKAMRFWQSMHPRPLPELPEGLEELFTPLSVQEARLNITVGKIRRGNQEI
jgi:hypothetical protein